MNTYSIYKSERKYSEYLAFYDSMLLSWPVPYESVFVDSSFGKSHLIRFGNPGKPVLLLLHGGEPTH